MVATADAESAVQTVEVPAADQQLFSLTDEEVENLARLALVIERLYRVRYLHRGNHPECQQDKEYDAKHGAARHAGKCGRQCLENQARPGPGIEVVTKHKRKDHQAREQGHHRIRAGDDQSRFR